MLPLNLDIIRSYPLVYTATPYSKYHLGIHMAFVHACVLQSRLLLDGVKSYSPIVQTHPIATYGNMDPLGHDFWLAYDRVQMDAAAGLLVAQMPGWRDSYGVAYEIEYMSHAGKPVHFLPEDYSNPWREKL